MRFPSEIVASGLLAAAVATTATAADISRTALAGEPTARLQVIHNAADPAVAEVDVYLGEALALDNFAFRTATPYIDVPAGVEVAIGIAPGDSETSADAIAVIPVTFDENETYVAIANGVLAPMDFV
ncbi:MAG: DUF4397 domain-containing protein, partial [Gemmatimonadetes bacterium]|nr:DUF4397 domain-containing protein [Gemmatimonadota bacterium]